MHKNPFWLVLLVIICLTTAWMTSKTYFLMRHYLALKETTTATKIDWSYESVSDEEFIPEGQYYFQYHDKTFQGISHLNNATLRNQPAAEDAIQHLMKKQFNVWFNPFNPKESSLHKSFPLKECLSTAILWGILLYFIGLGYYVGNQSEGK